MSLKQFDDADSNPPQVDATSQPDNSERKVYKIPNVDFARPLITPEGRDVLPIPLPADDYQAEHSIDLSDKELKVAEVIEENFLKIAAILGIDLDQTPVDYFFEDLEGGTLGAHYIERRRDGRIKLQKVSLQFKQLQESARNLSNKKSIIPGRFIFVLAHELFHVRQATHTPEEYNFARKEYISPKKDFKGYLNQPLEVEANKFATEYLKYLISIKDPMSAHFETYLASRATA